MNFVSDYFDLNNRIRAKSVDLEDQFPSTGDIDKTKDVNDTSSVSPNSESSVSSVPFGAGSYGRPSRRRRSSAAIAGWQQVIFYTGTVVGVLFSSGIIQFQSGKAVTISFTLITIIISALVALMLMPTIYEKAIEHDAPFIVQLGLFVQAGVFWSVIFTSIGKAYGG